MKYSEALYRAWKRNWSVVDLAGSIVFRMIGR
jgi:hypothetical protein